MMSALESDTAAIHSSQTSAWEWVEGQQTLGEGTWRMNRKAYFKI